MDASRPRLAVLTPDAPHSSVHLVLIGWVADAVVDLPERRDDFEAVTQIQSAIADLLNAHVRPF